MKPTDCLALTEVFQFKELTHFDLAFLAITGGIREALCSFERLFSRLHLDDHVTGDELFCLGDRPIDYGALGF